MSHTTSTTIILPGAYLCHPSDSDIQELISKLEALHTVDYEVIENVDRFKIEENGSDVYDFNLLELGISDRHGYHQLDVYFVDGDKNKALYAALKSALGSEEWNGDLGLENWMYVEDEEVNEE